jgi:hypothetical protein
MLIESEQGSLVELSKTTTRPQTRNKSVPTVEGSSEKYVPDILGNTIVRFLRTKLFAIIISFLLILLQSIHPAKVMHSFGLFTGSINIAYSYTFSFLLELFVIYYVVKDTYKEGEKKPKWWEVSKWNTSLYFAIFSIIINSYYYTSLLLFDVSEHTFKFDLRIIPAIAFAVIIPISIYRVSSKIND